MNQAQRDLIHPPSQRERSRRQIEEAQRAERTYRETVNCFQNCLVWSDVRATERFQQEHYGIQPDLNAPGRKVSCFRVVNFVWSLMSVSSLVAGSMMKDGEQKKFSPHTNFTTISPSVEETSTMISHVEQNSFGIGDILITVGALSLVSQFLFCSIRCAIKKNWCKKNSEPSTNLTAERVSSNVEGYRVCESIFNKLAK